MGSLPPVNDRWTAERIALLERLWAEGLSTSQIAARLGDGFTRNAVIGKVHRRGLSGRPRPKMAPRRPPRSRSYRPQPPVIASPEPEPEPVEPEPIELAEPEPGEADDGEAAEPRDPIAGAPTAVAERKSWECVWPIGDPGKPDFRFCCARRQAGSVYCPEHRGRAYVPHVAPRRRRMNLGQWA